MTTDEQRAMANRIKDRRKSLNYTQEQFAERLGISSSSYTRIENAFQKPALDTLIKISTNLNTTLDYLVFGSDDNSTTVITDTEMLTALFDYSDADKLKHAVEVISKLIKIKEKR